MASALLLDEWRFLTFRPLGPAIHTRWKAFLALGFVFTWLAGVGRYWDNPRADTWQTLGLGSVAYVCVLALIVWGLLAPLRPKNWSYRNVLLFVTLTAPPAWLYAVPVERFMAAGTARTTNAWLLAVVAIWRVALLVVFLKRVAGLSIGAVTVTTLLPLVIIVVALSLLNLEHVVFNVMGGIRPDAMSPHDAAYGVVLSLSIVSLMLAPFLAVGYLILVYRARRGARHGAAADRTRRSGSPGV